MAMLLMLSACGECAFDRGESRCCWFPTRRYCPPATQYSDYMKSATKSSDKNESAMVTRVGKKIAAATEAYLKANGMESEIKNFQWGVQSGER